MAYRNIGLAVPGKTTAQLADLVAKYGPTGTIQPNAIQLGVLIRDLTTGAIKVFNGTDFVAGTNYTP